MPDAVVPAREARVFARYLANAAADEVVAEAYARGLAAIPVPAGAWDRLHVAAARLHPLTARCADAYARLFARRGTLRHRLVLLLAILESRSPSAAAFDAAPPAPRAAVVLRLAAAGLAFALAALAGLVVLGPAHLVLRLGGRA